MITYKMLNYPITSGFGDTGTLHRVPHSGVDLDTPAGTPVQSLTDGTVAQVFTDQNLGDAVRIAGENGQEWIFGHLSKVSVKAGEHVDIGQVLGFSGGIPGTPGAGLTSGAHLHLATLENAIPVDPTAAIETSGLFEKYVEFNKGIWNGLLDMINPAPEPTFWDWLGDGLTTLVQILPEVCGLLAMAFLLIGMVGSRRAMNWAGTSVLLAFVGVILNAAIS